LLVNHPEFGFVAQVVHIHHYLFGFCAIKLCFFYQSCLL
jgi:hypothetical protein